MSQKIYTNLDIKGNATIGDISNATSDTDKFLVSDAGVVKYRTGSEMLSDLGVAPGVASNVQHQVKAGVAINKGQAVYVTSADGTNMIVGLASNTAEVTSSKTMGLLDNTVAINGFANVITEGLLAGLNTIGANAGDPVWLGTGGNLIYGLANKPSAPNHLVFIGIVTRVNANNGEIFVKVQNGFELNEIHDVDLKTTLPSGNDILAFEGAPVNLWKNKTISSVLGYTPYNASNPAGYTTNTGTVTSVSGTGGYGGLTLSGSVTTSGSLTLGGTPTGIWPIAISGNAATATNADYANAAGTASTATNANYLSILGGSGGNLNTMPYGRYYNYGSGSYWTNGPSGMSYGSVYNFGGSSESVLSLQLAADINHNSTSSTRTMWFRTGNNLGFQNDWKEVLHSGNYSSFSVPTSRTITINGTSYDLSANRSWTVTASETDTLATVTGRGASTSTLSTFDGGLNIGNAKLRWGGTTSPTLGFPFTGGPNAFWIDVNDGDTGGLAIDNDGTTIYGAGDSGHVFRVIDEDVYQATSNVDASTTFRIQQGQNGGGYVRGNFEITGTLSASGYNKTNWDTAFGWGNHASAGYAASGHTHDLGRYSLSAPALIDSVTASNFRTQLFGSSTSGYNISTARFNSTPGLLSGLNNYGTMMAWSGSDTHGFLAIDYAGPAAIVGGGNADNINWTKRLAFSDGTGASGTWGINITGNSTYSTNATRLYASDSSYVYGGANPYYLYMNYDGGSYWELKVSPASPGTVRVAYANTSGNTTGNAASSTNAKLVDCLSDRTDSAYYQVAWVAPNQGTNPNTGNAGTYAFSCSGVSIQSSSGTLRASTLRSNGYIYAGSDYGHSVVGNYSASRFQGVFAMGDSWKLPADGTYCGDHYGIAWSHPNAGGQAANLTDHGILIQTVGTTRAAISNTIWCIGDIIAYSDARVKDNVRVIDNPLERIKKVRGVTFTRIDFEDKEKRYAGVIAQEMREALPEAVSENSNGELSVSYGNTVSLLIECIKEQQTQIDELKQLVNKLIQK